MIIKRPKQAVLIPCGLPAKMVFRAYRPPSDLLSMAKIVRLLFSNSEQGALYDPSDMSTLFQDSAGTTPVTAVEQPVGRILDKSGRGNHATQATTTKRPVLSRRVNLFSVTEGQVVGDTTKYTCERVAGNSPPGTEGYIKLTATEVAAVPSKHFLAPSTSVAVSFYIKKGSSSTHTAMLRNATTATNFSSSTVNVDTGAVTGPWVCMDAGNGWWKLSLVHTTGISPGDTLSVYLGSTAVSAAGTYWLLAGITATSLTDAHLPYQRVNTATDYDADPAKFPAYLRFDGVDDALQTGNIDFTGTDKMTVWAGVRKLSDAAAGLVVELSATIGSNNGGFAALAPASAAANAQYGSKGTTASSATPSGLTSPLTFVMCGQSNIAAPSVSARINGVVAASNAFSQGTGNYGNYPLYIGSRGGAAYPFNGHLYSLIVRGAQSSLSQIEATEAYIKQKMRLP